MQCRASGRVFRTVLSQVSKAAWRTNEEADDANPERSAQSLALGLLRSMTVKPGNVLHYVLSLLERL